ncbi:hypothetical protein CEXT_308891 [Caerostris extrusa]|uniref:Uncharacterized protein n=1 Tax=Caerostris extrusa TaxID=172846 RepID=A0AAV4MSY9_CAEEX|nr:hypothetical protein CEXT_308891 [Caerostris extrusa]
MLFIIETVSISTGDQLQQEHLHPADHRHDGQPPVPGDAAPQHLQGPCLHPRLLRHLVPVPGGAAPHLRGHPGGEGRRHGGNPYHAGGQQVRRDRVQGDPDLGGARAGQEVELRLHGDLGQDQPQRQRALSGTAQHGEETERQPQHGHEQEEVPAEEGEVEGQVLDDVKTCDSGNTGKK